MILLPILSPICSPRLRPAMVGKGKRKDSSSAHGRRNTVKGAGGMARSGSNRFRNDTRERSQRPRATSPPRADARPPLQAPVLAVRDQSPPASEASLSVETAQDFQFSPVLGEVEESKRRRVTLREDATSESESPLEMTDWEKPHPVGHAFSLLESQKTSR